MSDTERGSRDGAFPRGGLNPLHHLRIVGRLIRPSVAQPGTAPGTLIHTGRRKVDEARVSFMDYDPEELREETGVDVERCFPLRDRSTTSWINVDGVHDVDLVGRMGEHFGLHPLVQEDVVHVGQRPKVEEHEEHLYVVLRMLSFDPAVGQVQDEQISLVLGDGYVLSFQEQVGDVFDPVRARVRSGKGRLRSRGSDYLAYALMDAVVDGYYQVLEAIGDRIERLDREVMDEPEESTLHRIHDLKRETLVIRKAVWPLRDVLGQMVRSDSELIHDETRPYLRDVYDHAVQVLDTVETLRDVAASLTDLYLSSVGQRTNDVMKVLTIMASIFIPLTFLAGIYGMNFENMPELAVPWAYPTLLGLMAALAGGMVWYFYRKGWL